MSSGHICFPHFHFSLLKGESQAVGAPAGVGRSSAVGYSGSSQPDDHTGHCHQARAPFSSTSPPQAFPQLPVPGSASATAGQLALLTCQNISRDRVPCLGERFYAKVSKLSCLTPSSGVVQHVQKRGNRKINSPKHHHLHLTSAHLCRITTHQLFTP